MSDFSRENERPAGRAEDMREDVEIAEDSWDAGLRAAFAAPPAENQEPVTYGRLQVLGELGRGGIGVILRAHDPDLRREVAIKVLQDPYADDPALVQRFVAEAQLAGQLEHPGIVPVHALGLDSRGRPYFLMKIVAGATLHELLEREKASPTEGTRLLQVFARVCETVAYAHARGIVHRDLKPANVMVGAFGEVQVVDWGFAKVLGAADPAGVPIATTPSEAALELSRPGAAMGTPGFMAPEQARGERDRIDARSDVYALGAILGRILATRPDPDGELLALAARCTEERMEARPADAGAVAVAVAAWLDSLAERTTKSRIAAAAAETRAAGERKARRLTLALSLAVLASAALALAWYFVDRSEAEKAGMRRDAEFSTRVLRARSQPPNAPRAVREVREALVRAGIDLETTTPAQLATELTLRGPKVTFDMARAFEEVLARGDTSKDWLAWADAVDHDGLRVRIRALWRTRAAEALRTLAHDLRGSPPEGATVVLLAHALGAIGRDFDALSLLEAAIAEYPDDLWLRVKLVQVYHRRSPPSRQAMESAIQAAKRLHPDPEWDPLPPPRRGG